MADLIATGYPDETTAFEAAGQARRLAADLIIQPEAIAVIARDEFLFGASALFLMLEKVTPDKAVGAMSKYGSTVLKTSLSKDDEKELQDALHDG